MESPQVQIIEGVISMTGIKIPLDESLVQSLLSSETEGIKKLLKQVLEAILEARATDIAGAGRYERSEARKCQRNGYREKWVTFRIGRLKIRIPPAQRRWGYRQGVSEYAPPDRTGTCFNST